MGIAITELTPVERTAFVTQYARALDSRWPRPILGDTLADEIVAKINYDFQALGVPSSAVHQTALRATPEVELYPAGARISTRLIGITRADARKARILCYRF